MALLSPNIPKLLQYNEMDTENLYSLLINAGRSKYYEKMIVDTVEEGLVF